VRIAHGIKRLFVRAPLDFSEEIGQFLAGSQFVLALWESRPGIAAGRHWPRLVRIVRTPAFRKRMLANARWVSHAAPALRRLDRHDACR
jgi:hypothetical protein